MRNVLWSNIKIARRDLYLSQRKEQYRVTSYIFFNFFCYYYFFHILEAFKETLKWLKISIELDRLVL